MLRRSLIKRYLIIIVSLAFLGLYLCADSISARFRDDILAVPVLSMDRIDEYCQGKEDEFIQPEITINDAPVAYDSEQNMLLIPQSLRENDFTGALNVPDGELYFLEDEAWDDKSAAISENKVFRLFWVREAQCWMYNVYFTGMPVAVITWGG